MNSGTSALLSAHWAKYDDMAILSPSLTFSLELARDKTPAGLALKAALRAFVSAHVLYRNRRKTFGFSQALAWVTVPICALWLAGMALLGDDMKPLNAAFFWLAYGAVALGVVGVNYARASLARRALITAKQAIDDLGYWVSCAKSKEYLALPGDLLLTPEPPADTAESMHLVFERFRPIDFEHYDRAFRIW